jgi:tRNA-specific 2-thiouridylase
MSGGVDSSVVAALLVEQGRRVIGVTARITRDEAPYCSARNVGAAQEVARQLGVRHHVVDLHQQFEALIVDSFIREYAAGRTPSPCGLCNPRIKFGLLYEHAAALGATAFATGHYARIRRDADGRSHLLRGLDTQKEQSYFLFGLTQQHLASAVFPLGEWSKHDVKAFARSHGLACRDSRESQELCFVPGQDYAAWIAGRCPEIGRPGDIVDTAGRKIGRHEGLYRYTIGQRRGLGLAAGRPLYVVALDRERNTLVVGDRKDTYRIGMVVDGVHWIAGESPARELNVLTQIRYNHPVASSRLAPLPDGTVDVTFDEPQFAVTPGQIAVFYADDEVLGGGWIERSR